MYLWPLAAISVYFLLAAYSIRLRRQAWKRLEADPLAFARTCALLSKLNRQELVPIAIAHATAAFPSFAIRRLRARVPGITHSEARNILLLMNYGPLDPPSSSAGSQIPGSAKPPMDSDAIRALAKATVEGSLPFPNIVGELMALGVESYHVDYAAKSFTFYSAGGATLIEPLAFEDLPSISQDWDAAALEAAILDSQQHGQTFHQFCRRAMRAGVQGYFAFLRGQRVTYLGRAGDQHLEWFPSARPSDT